MGGLAAVAVATSGGVTQFPQQQSPLLRRAFPGTGAFSISTRKQTYSPQQRLLFFRVQSGGELTTLDIRDARIPYVEYLHKEHGESLVDTIENFPNQPEQKRQEHGESLVDTIENFPNQTEGKRQEHGEVETISNRYVDSNKLRAMARMAEIGTDGQLPLNTLYLIDIGLEMDQIKGMARRYRSIVSCSLEKKIKPLVEFLLDVGVPSSRIPSILYRMPQLCGASLSENIIPSMAYFETLGLDKRHWAKVIHQYPCLLAHSSHKVKATVDYLYELGLSNRIGKVLTRWPQIIGCSIDDNLRPTAEYFLSMGVNLTSLVGRFPEVLSLSLERKLKPVTEFFLDKGYSINDIGTMASRFGAMYSLSLAKNLTPKWDFFLTMDYPRSELVKYPSYLGFSLERRIKPRYAQMRKCGVKLSMGKGFNTSNSEFEKILNKRMKKMLDARA